MNEKRVLRKRGIGALGVVLVALGACGEDRGKFSGAADDFDLDASTPDAPAECKRQCSLDGRLVVDSCTGAVLETCPAELACGAAVCQPPCDAAAADRSSNGCEFYFQMPRLASYLLPQSCFAAFLVNVSTQPAVVSLEYDGRELDISKSLYAVSSADQSLRLLDGPLPPGESAILFVADRPASAITGSPIEQTYKRCPTGTVPALSEVVPVLSTGIGPSFHVKSNNPLSAVSVYPFGGAFTYIPAATLLFPVTAWGKEHMLVTAWEAGAAGEPGVQIVASEDDTEITIVPNRAIYGGPGVTGTPASVPVTYQLQRGQHLQIVQSEELTGSVMSSTKPTSVFAGHGCALIPTGSSACEHLSQQLPAFEQWGNEYVAVGYRPRAGSEQEPLIYRIVAARDGTRLDYDPAVPGGAPVTMSAGEVATFRAGTGEPFVVRTQDAEHPIYVAAYMTGGGGDPVAKTDYGGEGDPEFVNVVPAGQYLSSYSFFADPSYAETSLVVIRAKTNGVFEDVWLECAGNLTGFVPIGMRGQYEFVRVDLSRRGGPGDSFDAGVCTTGLQRMRSVGAFTATVWGYDAYSSYAYPGGTAQRKLVATPLDIVR